MILYEEGWPRKNVSLWVHNGKLELLCAACTTAFTSAWLSKESIQRFFNPFYVWLLAYFSDERVANLAAAYAIIIGIYISVISIVATSVIGISPELVGKRRLDESLLFVTKIGCIENIAAVLSGILLPISEKPWCFVYFGLLISCVISFIKFVNVMFLVFRVNMKKMAESIDEENSTKNEILMRLEHIERDITELNKNQ